MWFSEKTVETKEMKRKTIRNKLSDKNKLTAKLIDKLTVYYGLCIKNCLPAEFGQFFTNRVNTRLSIACY